MDGAGSDGVFNEINRSFSPRDVVVAGPAISELFVKSSPPIAILLTRCPASIDTNGRTEVAILAAGGPRLFGDGGRNNRMHFPFVQFPAVITSGAPLYRLCHRVALFSRPDSPFPPLPTLARVTPSCPRAHPS